MSKRTPSIKPPAPLDREAPIRGSFLWRLFAVLLVAILALVAWQLAEVLVLAFAAILLALILRSLARPLRRWIKLPEGGAVAIATLVLLAILGLALWLFGSELGSQFDTLLQRLPQSVSQLIQQNESRPWMHYLVAPLQNAASLITGQIAALFGAALRTTVDAALVLFAGIYLAAQPERYRAGFLRLMPPGRRARIGEVLDLAGERLRRWLLGQALSMTVIGTLTALGLWAIGITPPFALGLVAGLLAFIPYVGAIVAAIPGILIAATQGAMPAAYAALVYLGVHLAEGNLITPLIQAEMVQLPPVLSVFAAVIFGLLFGPFGVLVAAPLTVLLLAVVETLYIEDLLGDRGS